MLFIGDGVDDHQLTLARNYLFGADGAFVFDRFEHRAAASVLTVVEADPSVPEYVGDSASGGTALATGVVTSRRRIATRAGSGEPVPTLMELASAAGKRTGIVATSSITDATPASFAAHIRGRYCQGPRDMLPVGSDPRCPDDRKSRGGPGSIAEQMAVSGIDLLLGGGAAYFDQPDDAGVPVWERARDAGYQVVRNEAELAAANSARRVLGLFGRNTLPVEWMGEGGARAERLRPGPDGTVVPPPFQCVPNPGVRTRPTLPAMTRWALDRLADAPQGFVLMVESASIDKQAHEANPCGQIGETLALDAAVAEAVAYQARHPDTLIVVASDHGHAAQIVPWPSLFGERPGPQHPPGKVARLRTREGGVLTVSYGSNVGSHEEHTGVQVPVFAQGPGAEAVTGLIRQSDVFDILRRALGL